MPLIILISSFVSSSEIRQYYIIVKMNLVIIPLSIMALKQRPYISMITRYKNEWLNIEWSDDKYKIIIT